MAEYTSVAADGTVIDAETLAQMRREALFAIADGDLDYARKLVSRAFAPIDEQSPVTTAVTP